ncbi:hypothetical protein KAU19_03415 [Candidatus Parcubacteria bacterium]|nr:hypothetical protein [Candidatus Parcubacteria bacterium]
MSEKRKCLTITIEVCENDLGKYQCSMKAVKTINGESEDIGVDHHVYPEDTQTAIRIFGSRVKGTCNDVFLEVFGVEAI